MKVKELITPLLIVVGFAILYFKFSNQEQKIIQGPQVKTIETRIEGKDTLIKEIQTRIIHDNSKIEILSGQLSELRNELINVKEARDTFLIVQMQDTIINTLTIENRHLKNVVGGQDSIIIAQRYIINSKDTIISIGNANLKSIKRQRNLAVLGNILQGAIIILNK